MTCLFQIISLFLILSVALSSEVFTEELRETIKRLACPINKIKLKNNVCLKGSVVTEEACIKKRCCYYKHYSSGEESCLKPNPINEIGEELGKFYQVQSSKDKKLSNSLNIYIMCVVLKLGCSLTGGNSQVNSTPPRKSCFWYGWSSWGSCTQGCYEKLETRFRRCSCSSPNFACRGPTIAHRPCDNPLSTQCGYWTSWSDYGTCSQTCGAEGFKTRRRVCAEGVAGDEDCPGSESETISCVYQGALNKDFTDWTICTATCGGGEQNRIAIGLCGEDIFESRACNEDVCCGKLPWNAWSACSTSCGVGIRSRSRGDFCVRVPLQVQKERCNTDYDGKLLFSEWSLWSVCTSTCVGGRRTRTRSHPCIASLDTEVENCGAVGEFLPWSEFGECSRTCVGGYRVRTRKHQCFLSLQRDRESCGNIGGYKEWTSWSACSGSCSGIRFRKSFHSCFKPDLIEREVCAAEDTWLSWTGWSSCSSVCLTGKQVRTRRKICSTNFETQEQSCGVGAIWSEYSQWSLCTATCGGGTRVRTRTHSCPDDLPADAISMEEEICNTEKCCFFGPWSDWTACSVTCGLGVQTRIRSFDEECTLRLGQNLETNEMECNAGPGSWLQWSNFGECSSICDGTKTRERVQSCSRVSQFDSEPCGIKTELAFDEWNQWSACSKSCGGGLRTRSRSNTCSSEVQVEEEVCNQDPGYYLAPGQWSECSSTCPGGSQFRESLHSCSLPTKREVQACGGPGSYGQWSQWSLCSSTCTGLKTRTKLHSCGAAPVVEEEICGSGGQYGPWSGWSICSQICSGGGRNRNRIHNCGLTAETETQSCGKDPYFENWSNWSSCTRTCGGGTSTRTRKGACGATDETEQISCGESACCLINEWSSWGSCSVSCGVGEKVRYQTSTCSNGSPINIESFVCDVGDGDFIEDWSMWSQCTATCGEGSQARFRTHSCKGVIEEVQGCNTIPCPRFRGWSSWSSCSSSCTTGIKQRSRVCLFGSSGDLGCIGELDETENCDFDYSLQQWQEWSMWSACTASCGGGTHSRSRSHPCLETETEVEVCNVNPGAYGEWTAWASCTKSCGGGLQYRERTHSCTLQTEKQTQQCNTGPGFFYNWSSWSGCTVSCGQGVRSRIRGHSCGLDGEMETEICSSFLVNYTEWSQWTECSTTCNQGTQIRQRTDNCGNSPEIEVKPCLITVCTYWTTWSSWSSCSSSCSDGLQTKSRVCRGDIANLCVGDATIARPCSNLANRVNTFSNWTFTTPCSVSCGEGVRTRRRDYLCGEPEIETVPCYVESDQLSEWSVWGTCSNSCGDGEQTRTRRNYCSDEISVESIPCKGAEENCCEMNWNSWMGCCDQDGMNMEVIIRGNRCTSTWEYQLSVCSGPPTSNKCSDNIDVLKKSGFGV